MFLSLPQSGMDGEEEDRPGVPRPLEMEIVTSARDLGVCLSGRVGKKADGPGPAAGL